MAKQEFSRVYVPWYEWEEVVYGMWDSAPDSALILNEAKVFMSNHKAFGEAMTNVVNHWPNSCKNALTDSGCNQRAWLGQAACAFALKCPQDLTRKAWGFLSDEQRLLANKEADKAIILWQNTYIKNKRLCRDVGEEMLF